jgi:transcription antitermination factor NusG
MATGKVEVYIEKGTHKVLTYFTQNDVKIGDKVRIINGVLAGKKGYIYKLGSDYSGYLFEVEKYDPNEELANKIEDLSQKIASLARELYDLSCELYDR